MGIDGRIYPMSAIPKGRVREDQFAFMDERYPIQVKQREKVGRPDIDQFEAAMMRENRKKGLFVAFNYTSDALQEICRFKERATREIVAYRVCQLLADEAMLRRMPPSRAKASSGTLRLSQPRSGSGRAS